MIDAFARGWEQLVGRLDGPMWIRFLLQPTMALILAVRAGVADARAHRAPYLWSMLASPGDRRQLALDGWRDVSTLFIVATAIDFNYQLFVLRFFYPVQTLIVAVMLAIVPYVLVRGPASRAARHFLPK